MELLFGEWVFFQWNFPEFLARCLPAALADKTRCLLEEPLEESLIFVLRFASTEAGGGLGSRNKI
jgi:hypothetical protein